MRTKISYSDIGLNINKLPESIEKIIPSLCNRIASRKVLVNPPDDMLISEFITEVGDEGQGVGTEIEGLLEEYSRKVEVL